MSTCYNRCYSDNVDMSSQHDTFGPLVFFPEAELREMNGKGCNLLVSPTSMPKSLGAITGQQVPHIRVHAGSSRTSSNQGTPCSGSGMGTGAVGPGSTVLLPALSLRRQVLTNRKHHGTFNVPQTSWQQVSSLPRPPGNSSTARLNGSQSGVKGKKLKHWCWRTFFPYADDSKAKKKKERKTTVSSFSLIKYYITILVHIKA